MVWVNLLPWRRRQRRKACQRWSVVLMLLALTLMVAGLPTLGQQKLNRLNEKGIRQRQGLDHQLEKQLQQVTLSDREREALKQQLIERQRRQQGLVRWSSFLSGLVKAMPETLWLSSISKSASTLTLAGFCKGVGDLDAFSLQLRKQGLVGQITAGTLSRVAQGRMAFNLLITLKPEADLDG
ncbi:PilN domain-containing protein [Erwinia sp. E_sp_B04_7]|uniref:PilN domain-containing protein n=2 Tax=Erwinia TaxID=551 RepID=UPI0030CDADE5